MEKIEKKKRGRPSKKDISVIEQEQEQIKFHFLDEVIGRIISRKLLAWLVVTILMFRTNRISSSDYILLTIIYISTLGILDIVTVWKSNFRKDGQLVSQKTLEEYKPISTPELKTKTEGNKR